MRDMLLFEDTIPALCEHSRRHLLEYYMDWDEATWGMRGKSSALSIGFECLTCMMSIVGARSVFALSLLMKNLTLVPMIMRQSN